MKGQKIGCTNVAIVLTLVGIIPLLGGALGLTKTFTHAADSINYSWLLQSTLLFGFGLVCCGYRSCLYLRPDSGVFVRKLVGYTFRKDQFYFLNFNALLVDIKQTVASENEGKIPSYYSISFVSSDREIEISDFIRGDKKVDSPQSWQHINSIAKSISQKAGLPVQYSKKVKTRHDIDS